MSCWNINKWVERMAVRGGWRPLSGLICEIVNSAGQGNFTFVREKSGKSQGISNTYGCGNHDAKCLKFYGRKVYNSLQEIVTLAIIREISDSNLGTGRYSLKSGVSWIIWESWQHYNNYVNLSCLNYWLSVIHRGMKRKTWHFQCCQPPTSSNIENW